VTLGTALGQWTIPRTNGGDILSLRAKHQSHDGSVEATFEATQVGETLLYAHTFTPKGMAHPDIGWQVRVTVVQ